MNTEDSQQDDNELIRQVQAGDIAVYEILVKKYQDSIAQQMRRFSTDIHDIEELTQQVFINAYTSINNYKPLAPFSHWLKTIASRTGYNFWRDQSRKPSFVSFEEWDSITIDDDIGDITPEEAELRLDTMLKKLLPNERHAISLVYLDDMSIREASKVTGWSEGKIKMLTFRGRKKLKEMIQASRRR